MTDESQLLKGQIEVTNQEKNDKVIVYHPPIPFPQRLKKTKLDGQFSKFLNMFKNWR